MPVQDTLMLVRYALALVLMLFGGAAFAQEKSAATAAVGRDTKPVVVFAAASLRTALENIGAMWASESGHKVTFSFAASSALARQIEQGSPADIFASADLKWMDYAAEKGLIRPETRVSLLGNTLVLVAPVESTSTLKIGMGFALAEALGDGRLAMGEPKTVPAGTYGWAALKALGVWDEVAPKVAGTENVRAALAFVARGEVPFGIVYGTDAKSEPKVRVVDTFPADTHPPIVYPFALTAASANANASAFLGFLTGSPAARAAFEAEGFRVLN